MKRFASLRLHGVLASNERDAAARSCSSAGATVTSWTATAGYTYASLALPADGPRADDLRGVLGAGAAVDEPGLIVLRVRPLAAGGLADLTRALTGRGRPAGVRDVRRDGRALVVEIDPGRTPLWFAIAVIDVELGSRASRTIRSLLPLDDATLAAYAGARLGDPAVDRSRMIETHLEPLLARSVP